MLAAEDPTTKKEEVNNSERIEKGSYDVLQWTKKKKHEIDFFFLKETPKTNLFP